MGFLCGCFGALILFLALVFGPSPGDRPLQYIAIGVGVVLIVVGLVAHYRWGGGDDEL